MIRGYKIFLLCREIGKFGMYRLTTRRVSSDLIQTFKIINGIGKVDKGLFCEFDVGGRRAFN